MTRITFFSMAFSGLRAWALIVTLSDCDACLLVREGFQEQQGLKEQLWRETWPAHGERKGREDSCKNQELHQSIPVLVDHDKPAIGPGIRPRIQKRVMVTALLNIE